MLKKWISGFKRKYKDKINRTLLIVFITVIFIIAAYITFSTRNKEETDEYEPNQVYKPADAVIGGERIEKERYEKDDNIVKVFIENCNNRKIEEAYNVLTDDCKEVLYPTLEDFQEKYVKRYFIEKRAYNLQGWINNGKYTIYKLRITEDMMSTGKYEENESYEDYITIIEDGKEQRLNINGYIGNTAIDKTTKVEGIEVTVKNIHTYMNRQEYILKVKNSTEGNILLSDMKKVKDNIRLVCDREQSYPSKRNSVNSAELRVASGNEETVKIEFDKKFSTGGFPRYIDFKEVIMKYDEINRNDDEKKTVRIKVEI